MKSAIIRTQAAGVHVGEIVSRKGRTIKLRNAVRVWRWRGANTLHEMALHGIDSAAKSGYTRVSEAVPEIVLLDALEVIYCTSSVAEQIIAAGWAR